MFGFCLRFFFLFLVSFAVVCVLCFVFVGFDFPLWNDILRLGPRIQEACHSIGFTCSNSTASKHLHNDLARAIKALEQKKDR